MVVVLVDHVTRCHFFDVGFKHKVFNHKRVFGKSLNSFVSHSNQDGVFRAKSPFLYMLRFPNFTEVVKAVPRVIAQLLLFRIVHKLLSEFLVEDKLFVNLTFQKLLAHPREDI